MDIVNAYIMGFGLTYVVSAFTRGFYLYCPNWPHHMSKVFLLSVGLAHLLAAFVNLPYLLIPLALIESGSCVAHWTGKVAWSGELSDFHMSQSLYSVMSMFDLIDITFLLSKIVF